MSSAGGTVTAGLISNSDYDAINSAINTNTNAISRKLSAVTNTALLTSSKMWVSDGSGKAQEITMNGDVSMKTLE